MIIINSDKKIITLFQLSASDDYYYLESSSTIVA